MWNGLQPGAARAGKPIFLRRTRVRIMHACVRARARVRVCLHLRIAVSEIWLGVIDGQEARVSVTISVVEVYSENLFDLLAPPMLRNQPLKLKQVSVSLFNGWLGWMRYYAVQYSWRGVALANGTGQSSRKGGLHAYVYARVHECVTKCRTRANMRR